jgi:hypothetical protein
VPELQSARGSSGPALLSLRPMESRDVGLCAGSDKTGPRYGIRSHGDHELHRALCRGAVLGPRENEQWRLGPVDANLQKSRDIRRQRLCSGRGVWALVDGAHRLVVARQPHSHRSEHDVGAQCGADRLRVLRREPDDHYFMLSAA